MIPRLYILFSGWIRVNLRKPVLPLDCCHYLAYRMPIMPLTPTPLIDTLITP